MPSLLVCVIASRETLEKLDTLATIACDSAWKGSLSIGKVASTH